MKHNRTHISEAFDFDNIKDNGPTRRVVYNALNTLFEDDIIVAKKAAIRNAIQAYVKTIRKYDDSNNIHFTYSDEDNILQIKIVDPSKIMRFMTNPVKKMIAKMFNAGMPAPKIVFKFKNNMNYDLNICISSGLSMEFIAVNGKPLTFYITQGLHILGLDNLKINKLILERLVLNDNDINYLYTLDVKNIETPKTRFTDVNDEIDYSQFKNFPNISFKNNQGNMPKGRYMNEIK